MHGEVRAVGRIRWEQAAAVQPAGETDFFGMNCCQGLSFAPVTEVTQTAIGASAAPRLDGTQSSDCPGESPMRQISCAGAAQA